MFLFLHTISEERLRNVQEENGLTPRRHGNTHILPANTISFADTLHTYAEAKAVLLLGKIPGYKRTDVQLLPSSTTKRYVWQQYYRTSPQPTIRLHTSTFCSI